MPRDGPAKQHVLLRSSIGVVAALLLTAASCGQAEPLQSAKAASSAVVVLSEAPDAALSLFRAPGESGAAESPGLEFIGCPVEDAESDCLEQALSGEVLAVMSGSSIPESIVATLLREGIPVLGPVEPGEHRVSVSATSEQASRDLGSALGTDSRCGGAVSLLRGDTARQTDVDSFSEGVASTSAVLTADVKADNLSSSASSCVALLGSAAETEEFAKALRASRPGAFIGTTDVGLDFARATSGESHLEGLLIVSRHPPLHDGAGSGLVDQYLAVGRSSNPEFMPSSDHATLFLASRVLNEVDWDDVGSTSDVDPVEGLTASILTEAASDFCGWELGPCREGTPPTYTLLVEGGRLVPRS